MDYLKEGIGLRAMAQRDPLVEYQREGHAMFQDVMAAIREQTVVTLFHLEVRKQRTGADGGAVELSTPQRPAFLKYTAPDEDGTPTAAVEREGSPGVGSSDTVDSQVDADAAGSTAAQGETASAAVSEDSQEVVSNRAQRRGKSARSSSKARRGKRR